MFEELKVITDLIGDLSGVGLQVFIIFVLAKLAGWAAVVCVIHFTLTKALAYMSGGLTRSQVQDKDERIALLETRASVAGLKAEEKLVCIRTELREAHINTQTAHAETEKVKHLYKILKEAKSNEKP